MPQVTGIGNKAFTVQESTNPYFKGFVGQSSDTPSRALIKNAASGLVNVTFQDGSVAAIYMTQGVLYPISATATNSDVLFLF